MNKDIDITVIVPVSERHDDVRALYSDYRDALNKTGRSYSFTYVVDGHFPQVVRELEILQKEGEPLKIIRLTRWFGEATALTVGFENSTEAVILTLPAYYQVEPSEIPKVLDGMAKHDMVITRRFPRTDSLFNRLQTWLFNRALSFITGHSFRDLGCGVRAFNRRVANEIPIYGDQHRFLPLLADRHGFKVQEVDVAQSAKERRLRVYRFGIYPRRVLDLLTVFFLVKFTKKPLRFFGLIGAGIFFVGAVITLYLVMQRLVFDMPLAERPALLLASLLVVLGVQVFALGLLGELIIFTHAKEIKEYTVEEIINVPTEDVVDPSSKRSVSDV